MQRNSINEEGGPSANVLQTTKSAKDIPIVNSTVDKQLPPAESSYTLSQLNSSETKYRTSRNSAVAMSLPPDSGGDTIDCVPQLGNQKKNCHEHPLTCNSDSLSPETSSPERLSYTKDGHYFLPLLKGEMIRLLKLSDLTQRDISMLAHTCVDIDEDVLGFLRSVTGKTKLLVSQKFKQFEGLCNSNINSTPDEDFPITNEDLMGFWDMLNLQIQHVDKLYKEVDQIRKNNWQTIEEIPTTPTDTSIFRRSQRLSSKTLSATTKMSPSATLLTQKREAQRKQLLELKQKNKGLNKDSKSPSVEIYISHNDV